MHAYHPQLSQLACHLSNKLNKKKKARKKIQTNYIYLVGPVFAGKVPASNAFNAFNAFNGFRV